MFTFEHYKRSFAIGVSTGSETGVAYEPHETPDTTVLATEMPLAAGTVPGCLTQRACGSVTHGPGPSEAARIRTRSAKVRRPAAPTVPVDAQRHSARNGDASSRRNRFGPPDPTRVRERGVLSVRSASTARAGSTHSENGSTYGPHETHSGTPHATYISLVVRTVQDGPDQRASEYAQ